MFKVAISLRRCVDGTASKGGKLPDLLGSTLDPRLAFALRMASPVALTVRLVASVRVAARASIWLVGMRLCYRLPASLIPVSIPSCNLY